MEELVAIGYLQRVWPGIYLAGAPTLTQRQLMRCAVLRAGGGPLAGRTALEIREVLGVRLGFATALTVRSRAAGVFTTRIAMDDGGRGVVKIRRAGTPPAVRRAAGLPATTVPRALVDLVGFGDGRLLDRAWRTAEYRGLLDHDALSAEVRSSRRPGAVEVRALVDHRRILTGPDTDLRSPNELPWLHQIVAAGLVEPEVNVPMLVAGRWIVVDFYWRELQFVLELDSPDHLTPTARARDDLRDAQLFEMGIDSLRFLDTAVEADPAGHLARLGAALERQRRRRRVA